MSKFIIGKSESGNVHFNLERLLETRLLLQANSGGGKSWAIRRLLEQTHGQVQQIVLDVEDEFHTLRENFDYVLAGAGGDCPADCRSAALLARKLLELNVSAIIGIYELKAHERVRFVRLFLDSLINAPRNLWHPVIVVVDEAHAYCPQVGNAESAGAVIDLMTRGRKRGFCGVLATQRISKLHKDAAAEANNKMIGRSALDVDMKRAADELGFSGREDQAQLRTLKPGEFFVFGPAVSDSIERIKVGAVKTMHPKAGQRWTEAPPPREKVKKILAQLADLPREAEKEVQTITTLQARIRELEKAKPTQAPAQSVSPIVKEDKKAISELQRGISERDTRLKKIAALAGTLAPIFRASKKARLDMTPEPIRFIHTPQTSLGQSGLKRMLIALAQRNGLSASQLGVRAGLSSKSGTFNTYLGQGRTNGWITGHRGKLEITEEGIKTLGTYESLPQGPELLAYWLRELGQSGAARILTALAEAYPREMGKAELGEATGMSHLSGTFNTYLGRLRTLELVEGSRDLKASSEFFK